MTLLSPEFMKVMLCFTAQHAFLVKARVHTPGLSIAVATCIRLWVSLSLHLLAIKLEEFRQVHLLSFNEIDMKMQIIEQSDRNKY